MAKKCIICGEKADYCIKDTSDYYCEECAVDHFGDISMLIKVEEQAQALKEVIKEKMKLEKEGNEEAIEIIDEEGSIDEISEEKEEPESDDEEKL